MNEIEDAVFDIASRVIGMEREASRIESRVIREAKETVERVRGERSRRRGKWNARKRANTNTFE